MISGSFFRKTGARRPHDKPKLLKEKIYEELCRFFTVKQYEYIKVKSSNVNKPIAANSNSMSSDASFFFWDKR